MKNLFFAAISFLFLNVAQADFSTVKCLSAKETAEELLNIEVAGREVRESTCMKPENFPRYRVGIKGEEGDGSEKKQTPIVLSEKKPFEIKSVTKDKDDRYKVKFNYKLANGKTVADELGFVLYESGEMKNNFGCAAIISSPKTPAIHASCLPH